MPEGITLKRIIDMDEAAELTSSDYALVDSATGGPKKFALGNELSSLKEDISDVADALALVEGQNKFNPNTLVEGYSIGTNGIPITNAGSFTSDFIPCEGGQTFYYVRKTSNAFYGVTAVNASHFAQYDSNKTFITGTRVTWANSVVLNENCAYVRFSNPVTQLSVDGNLMSVTFDYIPTAQTIAEWQKPYYSVETEEIKAFENAMMNALILVQPENKLNTAKIKENTIINALGNEETNTTCFTTDYFIPAKYGDKIVYTLIANGTYYHTAVKLIKVAMYNSAHEFLGNSNSFVNDFVISEPTCAYIRCCVPSAALNATLAEISINVIPPTAAMSEYFDSYYSSSGISEAIKASRKVLWLGTSIPTYGYPQILGRICGATVNNEAIGSSCIAKGIEPNITAANVCGIRTIWGLYGLTQTVAEKQTMIDNWSTIASEIGDTTELTDSIKNIALASSYEIIVDPYLTGDNAVDLIVINHAYNDSTEYAVAPENGKLNPHYLEGAYNWLIKRIIEANPNIGIVIFGHYSDLPTSKETALQNVADRWNIPYYLLKNDLEWSSTQTITTTKKINSSGEWETISATDMTIQAMWLGDGVHPLGVASKRIAQVSQNVFADWLKMYCDN